MDFSSLGLDVPGIDGDLKSVQLELGASFNDDGIVSTYGTARQAVEATSSGVSLVDRSHWPRIRLAGRDRIPLLQRFTTQDFSSLITGQGCDTVLVDSQGYALDLVTAYLSDSHVLMLVSPEGGEAAVAWLKQQAADAELKVTVQDVSQRCTALSLVGPESENVLKELMGEGMLSALGTSYGANALLKFRNTPVLVAVGCGLPCPGYTLIADEAVSGELFSVFAAKGCLLMGEDEWECSRVLAGRPALPQELGSSHSPLEAGLYHAVNLTKSIGSKGLEALVQARAWGRGRELWGLKLQAAASRGADITIDGHSAGIVTSVTHTPTDDHFALGFIQPAPSTGASLCAGSPVLVGGTPAVLASIPFASRSFLSDLLVSGTVGVSKPAVVVGPGAEMMAQQAEQERLKQAQEAAAAQEARLQKIKENEARLAAWQAKVLGQKSL